MNKDDLKKLNDLQDQINRYLKALELLQNYKVRFGPTGYSGTYYFPVNEKELPELHKKITEDLSLGILTHVLALQDKMSSFKLCSGSDETVYKPVDL